MQQQTHIVVLGAGFGGIYTVKRLHKHFHKQGNVKITIVNNTNYFLFTPLLHEVATGAIHEQHIVESIRKVFTCCPIDITIATVKSIDPDTKTIHTDTGTISYDYVVVALGSDTAFFNTPGAEELCFTLKSLEDAKTLKSHYVEIMDAAAKAKTQEEQQALLTVAIIGAGPTGVELATETAELFFDTFPAYYPKELIDRFRLVLIQRDHDILLMFDEVIRKKATAILAKNKVEVLCNTSVVSVSEQGIMLSTGEHIPTHTPIWVAGIQAQKLTIGQETPNRRGCFVVGPTLQLANDANIFVIGDMAHCEDRNTKQPFPALAQVAVKQGIHAADTIAQLIQGKPATAFHMKLAGLLVSLGQWNAAGQIGKMHMTGKLTWWLWRTIYVSKLLSTRKKFQVIIDWTLHLFSKRDISNI